MQRMSTPIFVGSCPAVYKNECPSIHGVREQIIYSINAAYGGKLPTLSKRT